MKDGWVVKKLGDVCEVRCGSTPSKSNSSFWSNGTIPWFTINDIRKQGRHITHTELKVSEEAATRLTIFPVGTVLLCCTASLGECAIAEIPLTSNQQFNGLTIKEKSSISAIYLLYFCFTLKDVLKQLSGKATIDFVSNKKVCNISIPVPPLSEQKRIVSILDSAFAKIEAMKDNAARNLANAKELFQSELQNAMMPKEGWLCKKVCEIGEIQTGTTPPTSDKGNYGNYIAFIKPADVNFEGRGGINISNEMLSEKGFLLSRCAKAESILMVCIGATIGKVGFSTSKVTFNQQINVLTPKTEYYPKFFYYGMLEKHFQNNVIKEGKGAQATLPIINKTKWGNLRLSFPSSKTEQQLIVSHLDSLSEKVKELEAAYNKTIADCEELKQSLLRKAFNGEL